MGADRANEGRGSPHPTLPSLVGARPLRIVRDGDPGRSPVPLQSASTSGVNEPAGLPDRRQAGVPACLGPRVRSRELGASFVSFVSSLAAQGCCSASAERSAKRSADCRRTCAGITQPQNAPRCSRSAVRELGGGWPPGCPCWGCINLVRLLLARGCCWSPRCGMAGTASSSFTRPPSTASPTRIRSARTRPCTASAPAARPRSMPRRCSPRRANETFACRCCGPRASSGLSA